MSAESDRRAVADAIEGLAAALNRADYDAAVAMMSDDAVFWPDAAPEMAGKAAARAAYDRLAGYRLTASFSIAEILVSGDLALARGFEHFRVEPPGEGEPVEIDGRRGFSVWRRETDGSWKNIRGMTNWPAPRAPAPS